MFDVEYISFFMTLRKYIVDLLDNNLKDEERLKITIYNFGKEYYQEIFERRDDYLKMVREIDSLNYLMKRLAWLNKKLGVQEPGEPTLEAERFYTVVRIEELKGSVIFQ